MHGKFEENPCSRFRMHKRSNRQTDKQTNGQTDKQTNRQTDKRTRPLSLAPTSFGWRKAIKKNCHNRKNIKPEIAFLPKWRLRPNDISDFKIFFALHLCGIGSVCMANLRKIRAAISECISGQTNRQTDATT